MKTIDEFKKAEQKAYTKRLKQHIEETKLAYKAWTMLHAGIAVYQSSDTYYGYVKYDVERLDPKHFTATCKLSPDNTAIWRGLDAPERHTPVTFNILDLYVMHNNRITSLRKLAKADKTMNIQYNGQDIVVLTDLSHR